MENGSHTPLKIGLLALQGAFLDHKAFLAKHFPDVVTREVRLPEHLEGLDGLVIPGGESTTMSILSKRFNLTDPLKDFVQKKPVLATCAGTIMISREITNAMEGQITLDALDLTTDRNHFGAQISSFETDIKVENVEGDSFHAVFIRAPGITRVGDGVSVLAKVEEEGGQEIVIGVENERIVALSFHPELTNDPRLHQYWIQKVQNFQQSAA